MWKDHVYFHKENSDNDYTYHISGRLCYHHPHGFIQFAANIQILFNF